MSAQRFGRGRWPMISTWTVPPAPNTSTGARCTTNALWPMALFIRSHSRKAARQPRVASRSAPRRSRSRAAGSSTARRSSHRFRDTPIITACSAPRSWKARKPRVAIRSISRCQPRPAAYPWSATGIRWACAARCRVRCYSRTRSCRRMRRGVYFQAAMRWPHMFLTLSPTYVGLAQAAYDFTVRYLRGEVPGTPPVKRRMYPTKQIAVAQMQIKLEQVKAIWFQAIAEGRANPTKEQVLRAYAAQYSAMEGANEIATLAIRTCGGQAMLKSLALERIYRDSRCGSLMLPWTAELCLDRIGREALYETGESDD